MTEYQTILPLLIAIIVGAVLALGSKPAIAAVKDAVQKSKDEARIKAESAAAKAYLDGKAAAEKLASNAAAQEAAKPHLIEPAKLPEVKVPEAVKQPEAAQ